MRLTLRTMLAYLDGILEPADREEIGRKIEESEFARQLVQRLRDSASNPRLSAPKISGKAGTPDPNTVAEYLDNTLAGERVPDFEKLCLDSDVDLAEVAACHQILTMVLAQPAEIDLEMKQHMYGVVNQASQTSEAGGPQASGDRMGALPDEIWVKPRRRKVEIPDYLRDRAIRSKWKPVLAAILLIVILAGALAVALGPLDRTHPVARLLGFSQPVENQPAAVEAPGSPGSGAQVQSNAPTDPSKVAGSKGSDAKNPASSTDVGVGGTQTESGSSDAAADQSKSEAPAAMANVQPSEQPAAASPTANDVSSAPPTAANIASAEPTPGGKATMLPPPLPTPAVGDATTTPAAPVAATGEIPKPGDVSAAGVVPGGEAPQPPMGPANDNTPLGRLLPSKSTVLLRFDAGNGQWQRVASGEAVTANEPLLVLPTYRPTIALLAGLTLQVPPETLLELKAPDVRGIPSIKLVYGRLVVMTVGKAGAKLGLDLGGINGVISFVDADATLGVDVHRHVAAGSNPEVEEPQVMADVYAARGHLEWSPVGGASIALNGPQLLVLNPANPTAGPTASPAMPKWIEPEQLWPLDAQASEFLAQSLHDQKQLPIALHEMVDHRKVEIKSLGAQCLALLDDFEPLVAAFSDSDQRPVWPVEIASVKESLARGSGTAAKVHEAFVKQHGEELGKDLYRMFLGYTKEQLQGGEATKLVDFLDNDSLDFRVLASSNLQEITNKTFSYRPEAPAASRAQPLRRWQEELRTGGIVPKELGSPK